MSWTQRYSSYNSYIIVGNEIIDPSSDPKAVCILFEANSFRKDIMPLLSLQI